VAQTVDEVKEQTEPAQPGAGRHWPFAAHDTFAALHEDRHRLALIHSLPGLLVWPLAMVGLAFLFQFIAGFLWMLAGGPLSPVALNTAAFTASAMAYFALAGLMWLRLERYDAHHRAFAILPVRAGDVLAALLVLIFMVLVGSRLTIFLHELAMSDPAQTLSGGAARETLSNIDDIVGSGAAWWSIVLLTLIAAPLVEEILFRGWMLPMMLARGVPAVFAVLISAAAFGTVHIAQGLLVMISTFILGIALGTARLATGRLAAPVLGHVANNVWAVIVIPAILARLGTGD